MTFCVPNKNARIVRPRLDFHTVTRFAHFGYAQAPTSRISKKAPPVYAAAAGLLDKTLQMSRQVKSYELVFVP